MSRFRSVKCLRGARADERSETRIVIHQSECFQFLTISPNEVPNFLCTIAPHLILHYVIAAAASEGGIVGQ